MSALQCYSPVEIESYLQRDLWPRHCLLLPVTVLNSINGQINKICPVAVADTVLIYLTNTSNHLPVPSSDIRNWSEARSSCCRKENGESGSAALLPRFYAIVPRRSIPFVWLGCRVLFGLCYAMNCINFIRGIKLSQFSKPTSELLR